MPHPLQRHWPAMAALITIAIWTSFIVVARASASHHLLPLDILAARVVGAGLLVLPYVWWQRALRAPRPTQEPKLAFAGWSPLPWVPTLAVGVLAGFLYSGLAYTGFFYAPATHASVLLPGALPFWTTLLSVLWLKERLPRQRWIGLGLIFAGGLLVASGSLSFGDAHNPVWIGHVFFLCASLTWSAYSVVVRRYQLNALDATSALTVTAVFVYLPAYLIAVTVLGVPSHFSSAPWAEILFQTTYQGWGTLVIAGITFNTMVKHYGPVRTTMMTALVPSLSALSAVLWLGEAVTPVLLGGLTLVTCGILVGALQRSAKP